jgi:hypothetical protein
LGIESDRLGRRSAVVHEHRIQKGNQCIETVPRGPSGPSIQGEALSYLGFDDEIECREVAASGLAFDAAQGIKVRGARNGAERRGECLGRASEGFGLTGIGASRAPRSRTERLLAVCRRP